MSHKQTEIYWNVVLATGAWQSFDVRYVYHLRIGLLSETVGTSLMGWDDIWTEYLALLRLFWIAYQGAGGRLGSQVWTGLGQLGLGDIPPS